MSKWNGNGLPPVGEVCELKNNQATWGYDQVTVHAVCGEFAWVSDVSVIESHPFTCDVSRLRPLKSEAEHQSWPEMTDRFYEGLGWMHAECCAAIDRGDDPRGFEVGSMVERCIKDLTKSTAERKRDDAVFTLMFDCQSLKVSQATALIDAGYRKANELTDEQIVSHVGSANFWRGAKWARAQILGEES